MTWKRKEIIGDATLYLGDCLEIMPILGKVDAVVTDPPYGTEDICGGYSRSGATIRNDKDLSMLQGLMRINPTDKYLIFYSPRMAPDCHNIYKAFHWDGQIIWDKKAPGLGRRLRYQHENIAVLGHSVLIGDTFSVLRYYRDAEAHPHQKPLALLSHLITIVSARTILDPFMGSGTTGVACVNLGRKFIGIEIEEKYFDIACKRIEKASRSTPKKHSFWDRHDKQ